MHIGDITTHYRFPRHLIDREIAKRIAGGLRKDFTMTIVVYTAVSDGYDVLQPVSSKWKDARFVAFSDNPEQGGGWEYQPLCHDYTDPCRNAKIHKILPHRYFPEADFTIWIDGCVRIISEQSVSLLLDKFLKNADLAVFRHRIRDCAYEEAGVCIERGKDLPEVIERQMARYRIAGYPEAAGLAECTVLIRRNTAATRDFCEAWYAEINQYSRRDQLSFNYTTRRLDFRYNEMPGSIVRNKHFLWLSHGNGSMRTGEEADPGRWKYEDDDDDPLNAPVPSRLEKSITNDDRHVLAAK